MTELSRGAHAIYNCANPPYDKWATAWLPLAASFIGAAEATDARLVTMSNLYGFARDTGTTPIGSGRPKARASDYFGPGLGETSHLGDRVVPRTIATKSVSMVGAVDVIHSWSYIDDVCATLATLGTDDRALGRAWHVPTLDPATATEMVHHLCAEAGVAPVKVSRIPKVALRAAGLFMLVMRELIEMLYQFEAPFVIEATDTTDVFGIEATALDVQTSATIESYRAAVVNH